MVQFENFGSYKRSLVDFVKQINTNFTFYDGLLKKPKRKLGLRNSNNFVEINVAKIQNDSQ
jgi:hypothetical protein